MKLISHTKKIKIQIIAFIFIMLSMSCRNSQSLFQEDAKNWEISGKSKWEFSNNELIGKAAKGLGLIKTKQTYSDFILELEFKPDAFVNSGVFIRCENEKTNSKNCYEINIWDNHPNQELRTGSIVKKMVPITIVNTNNKWNTYKIKAKKELIQVWINDTLTANLKDNSCSKGYIALQATGSGEIRFRNIKIKTFN